MSPARLVPGHPATRPGPPATQSKAPGPGVPSHSAATPSHESQLRESRAYSIVGKGKSQKA